MTHHTDAERPWWRDRADEIELQVGMGKMSAPACYTQMLQLLDADRRAPAAPVQGLTADDIKEPKNGTNWRVVWWNESCRMLLPADKQLDSFQAYKNGTMQFTLKKRAHDNGGAA